MATYITAYDLTHHAESKDYENLIAAIKTFCPAHRHFQKSVRLVQGFRSAQELCALLEPHIHPTDKLLVIPAGNRAFVSQGQHAELDSLSQVLGYDQKPKSSFGF